MLTILNGPSAGGKTTLMEDILNGAFGKPPLPVKKLVTVTTRPPRVHLGEVDGIHYHFLTPEQYEEACVVGDMIEKTKYAGVKYGVLRQDLEPLFDPNNRAIVVMDWFGFGKMTEFLGKNNVDMVFVYASLETLQKRLEERGETDDVIRRRLEQAKEREFVGKAFSSLVINTDEDDEQAAFDKLYSHLQEREMRRAMIYAQTGIDITHQAS